MPDLPDALACVTTGDAELDEQPLIVMNTADTANKKQTLGLVICLLALNSCEDWRLQNDIRCLCLKTVFTGGLCKFL